MIFTPARRIEPAGFYYRQYGRNLRKEMENWHRRPLCVRQIYPDRRFEYGQYRIPPYCPGTLLCPHHVETPYKSRPFDLSGCLIRRNLPASKSKLDRCGVRRAAPPPLPCPSTCRSLYHDGQLISGRCADPCPGLFTVKTDHDFRQFIRQSLAAILPATINLQ